MTDLRSRAWCFTINNYTQDQIEQLKSLTTKSKGAPRYLIFGKEIAPTTGTPHLQGYIYRDSQYKWSQLMRVTNFSWLKPAKGTAIDNEKYCTKDADFFEFGDMPTQGERTDVTTVTEMVRNGSTMRDIIPHATSLQTVRMAEIALKYFEPKRNWNTVIVWLYGKSGCGKTRMAASLTDDPYYCMETSKWLDGYDAHKHIIIDDYRLNFSLFSTLLRLLDRYPMTVETKGGTRQFVPRLIFVTSPQSPLDMWANRTPEDLFQLNRRIEIQQEIFSPGTVNALFQKKNLQEKIEEVLQEARLQEINDLCET